MAEEASRMPPALTLKMPVPTAPTSNCVVEVGGGVVAADGQLARPEENVSAPGEGADDRIGGAAGELERCAGGDGDSAGSGIEGAAAGEGKSAGVDVQRHVQRAGRTARDRQRAGAAFDQRAACTRVVIHGTGEGERVAGGDVDGPGDAAVASDAVRRGEVAIGAK